MTQTADITSRLEALLDNATPGPASVECDDDGLYVLLGTLKGEDEHLARRHHQCPRHQGSRPGRDEGERQRWPNGSPRP